MKNNDKCVVKMNTEIENEVLKKADQAFNAVFKKVSGGDYAISPSSYLAKNRNDLRQITMNAYIEGYKLYCKQNNLDINNLSDKERSSARACAYKRAEWAFKDTVRTGVDNPMDLSIRDIRRDNAVKNFFEQRHMKVTENLCDNDLHMLMRQMDMSNPEKVKEWIID